jgi:hypothetical protein
MTKVSMPLSGDVTQTISPFTTMFGSQTSNNYTIELGHSTDPDIEKEVLDEVGSYGRQLGRICDVLHLLLHRIDPKDLSKHEAAALEMLRHMSTPAHALRDFQHVLHGIAQVKARHAQKKPGAD